MGYQKKKKIKAGGESVDEKMGLTALGYGLGVQNRKNYQRQYLHVWLANGKNKKKKWKIDVEK